MNKEIMEAVTKHLPAMQMEVLKQELEKEKLVDSLRDEMAILKVDKAKLAKTIEDITKNMVDQDILKKRVEVVEKREQALELEILKKDVQCSKDTLVAVRDLAMAAFRNPTVYKSYNKPMEIQSGNYINQVTENETISTY